LEEVIYNCPICKDSKHVLRNGIYVRCSCLESELLARKFSEAGIIYPAEELTLTNLRSDYEGFHLDEGAEKVYNLVNESLVKKIKPSKVFCFQGSSNGPLEIIVQTLLATAVRSGFKVKQFSLDELINLKIKEDYLIVDQFKRCDIVSVYFGNELQFNVGPVILQELVRLHWTHPNTSLILHTNVKYDEVGQRYGDAISNMLSRNVDSSSSRLINFISVEV
jgi:hypothetical protein